MSVTESWTSCATCGESLSDEVVGTSHLPCPICGSVARIHGRKVESRLVMTDSLTGVTTRDGKPIGFAESGTPEIRRHTTYSADGKIVLNLEGLAPNNEDDVPEVCQILVTALNGTGIEASIAGEGIQDVDCRVMIGGDELGIQVVRALTTQRFWKELNAVGAVNDLTLTVSDCERSLREAIRLKERKIPPPQRTKLILLLDAYRVPALAIGTVTDRFKKSQAASVRLLGFHSIYVVGPTPLFVSRLDEEG
jgi:predicted RNA-binding Zn-ribbon protein involved in translation (DUF1610 family)